MMKPLLALLVLLTLFNLPLRPVAATGLEFETRGDTELIKAQLVEMHGESLWIRIEKTGQKLRFVSTSTLGAGDWHDHPVTRVLVQFPDCPTASMGLIEELKLQKEALTKNTSTSEKYSLDKSHFLQALSDDTVPESACTVGGIDSVVLPEGRDFYKGSILSVDFVQLNKLWHLTFELTPTTAKNGNKLSVRLLSSSP